MREQIGEDKQMRSNYLYNLIGTLCGVCLMAALLLSSVEFVIYGSPGYFERQYEKNRVLEKVHMEMDDLLMVTEEMMDYLRGERPDLHIVTTIDGEEREFFNQREIAHMEDVRQLFLAAYQIRRICILALIAGVMALAVLRARLKEVLPRCFCAGAGIFLVIAAGLAAIIATDFTKYFYLFHEIFFDNDLWILDPDTDLLIRIVPEAFFMETAGRIGAVFAAAVILVLAACLLLMRRSKAKHSAESVCTSVS